MPDPCVKKYLDRGFDIKYMPSSHATRLMRRTSWDAESIMILCSNHTQWNNDWWNCRQDQLLRMTWNEDQFDTDHYHNHDKHVDFKAMMKSINDYEDMTMMPTDMGCLRLHAMA